MVLKLWHFGKQIRSTWNVLKCGAGEVDQKYLERFEMWCWRRMENSWTDHVRNEVLHRVKEERNIIHTVKRRKANWIGHILRTNCHKTRYLRKDKGRENEEEDVSRYTTSLTNIQNAETWKRKHQIALCGKFILEEAVDVTSRDYVMN
jgi:hypothetical protein